jgi:lysozyme
MRASLMAFYTATALLAAMSPALSQQSSGTMTETDWAPLPDDYSVDFSRKKLFKDAVVPVALDEKAEEIASQPVTSLAIPKDFVFPDDAIFDKIKNTRRSPSQFVIDVSHYTGDDIDFSTLRVQHVVAVYAKATQGTGYRDDHFKLYWAKLASLQDQQSLRRGAYHFLSANADARQQAESFLNYVQLQGGFKRGDLPPCVDFEWDRTRTNPDQWTGHSGDEMVQKLKIWLDVVADRTKRVPIIYTAQSFLAQHALEGKFTEFSEYPIWIADYSISHKAVEKPAVPLHRQPLLWQFASDTHLTTGYDDELDASIFYGSLDQFNSSFDR